ncbi:MAG: hypothetical protein ACJAS3_001475 [Roseivirga sp.]|jgi:hypothetical protein
MLELDLLVTNEEEWTTAVIGESNCRRFSEPVTHYEI